MKKLKALVLAILFLGCDNPFIAETLGISGSLQLFLTGVPAGDPVNAYLLNSAGEVRATGSAPVNGTSVVITLNAVNGGSFSGTETFTLRIERDGTLEKQGLVFENGKAELAWSSLAAVSGGGAQEELALVSGDLEATLTGISGILSSGMHYQVTLSGAQTLAPRDLNWLDSLPDTTISITLKAASSVNITLDGTGSMLKIGRGITLTLGSNITLTGSGSNTAPLVEVDAGGVLVMESGSKITGNGNGSGATGGAVYLKGSAGSPARLEMKAGSAITANSAAKGGAVYVDQYGALTLSGGTIGGSSAGNGAASALGGGVYLKGVSGGAASFSMTAGSILGNTADKGGGVYVDEYGTFTFSGGAIGGSGAGEGNSVTGGAGKLGGGVYIGGTSAAMTMSGSAAIIANAADKGGGVYVAASGAFTISAGNIKANTALSSGGGIYAAANLTANGGVVGGTSSADGNTITGTGAVKGGGVYLEGTLSGSGLTAQYNAITTSSTGTDAAQGGGVYVAAAATVSAPITASNNSAKTTAGTGNAEGGGMYAAAAPAAVTANGNSAESAGGAARGGGAYIDAAPTGTLTAGNNTAKTTGGAAQGGGLYLSLSSFAGAISATGNKAESAGGAASGGGVYLAAGSHTGALTLTGNIADAQGASAAAQGGGLYLAGGASAAPTSAAVTGGNTAKTSDNSNNAGAFGGGVFIAGGASGGSFTLAGAESAVSGNTVSDADSSKDWARGAGVFVEALTAGAGTFIYSAGSFGSGDKICLEIFDSSHTSFIKLGSGYTGPSGSFTVLPVEILSAVDPASWTGIEGTVQAIDLSAASSTSSLLALNTLTAFGGVFYDGTKDATNSIDDAGVLQ
jgi:hypothetical protein